MATMKPYTDIEQSKKLAEILPLESADMTYYACVKDWRGNPIEPKWRKPANLTKEELTLPCSNFQEYKYVPCWSLAALLSVLPFVDFTTPQLIGTPKTLYMCKYNDDLKSHVYDNAVDACYDMILELHELKML